MELGEATVPIHNPPNKMHMIFTFGNVLLLIALVAVAFLFGFRQGRRWGYGEGFADGGIAEEKRLMKFLTKEEKARIKAHEKRVRDELKKLFVDNE